tara:strand:- start:527 stop:820 length:294 start_codon:yes stop_codon:yes gene_type:complete
MQGKHKKTGETLYKSRCKPCIQYLKTQEYNKTIEDFFGGFICSCCGFKGEPSQFDCHHINPKTKTINVALLRGYSKGKIIQELRKCELLCANCHRLK